MRVLFYMAHCGDQNEFVVGFQWPLLLVEQVAMVGGVRLEDKEGGRRTVAMTDVK